MEVSIKQRLGTQTFWSTKENVSTRHGPPSGTWNAWDRSRQQPSNFRLVLHATSLRKNCTVLRSANLLLGVSHFFCYVRLPLPGLFLIGRSNPSAPFFFSGSVAPFFFWPPLLDLRFRVDRLLGYHSDGIVTSPGHRPARSASVLDLEASSLFSPNMNIYILYYILILGETRPPPEMEDHRQHLMLTRGKTRIEKADADTPVFQDAYKSPPAPSAGT